MEQSETITLAQCLWSISMHMPPVPPHCLRIPAAMEPTLSELGSSGYRHCRLRLKTGKQRSGRKFDEFVP